MTRFAIRIFSKVHGFIYQITGGRLGSQLGSIPMLLLTTTGRKSGKKRTVPLVGIPHGSGYILIASFGGSPTHPAWFLNIRENPSISIRIGSLVTSAEASIIDTSDSEYEEMWEKAVDTYPGYDDYKQKSPRDIPIVLVTPQ